ncbi:MAG TPA: hypothetical protein VFA50_00880 [Stellaceae bacterium]|nr:hypothetical protein [Stellaceae bacterium]
MKRDGSGKGSSHSMPVEDAAAVAAALAYVTLLYRELSAESGSPTLGTQNQLVEFILADAGLRAAVRRWADALGIDEASMAPPHALPRDDAYRRIRDRLRRQLAADAVAGGGAGDDAPRGGAG